MSVEETFQKLIEGDVRFGYLDRDAPSSRQLSPQVILNSDTTSMLRALRDELKHCASFSFSVAFVTPRAIALLKQELIEFSGKGLIVTSDYLGFNSPRAFAELHALTALGIDVRLHRTSSYHPKGYVFGYEDRVTAILGSSNLTETALALNHEWNLRVSATRRSDLADQLAALVDGQVSDSDPLSQAWIDAYAADYTAPSPRPRQTPTPRGPGGATAVDGAPLFVADFNTLDLPRIDVELGDNLHNLSRSHSAGAELRPTDPRESSVRAPEAAAFVPNAMQVEALEALQQLRDSGRRKGLVISATGTGKTILSALDVRKVQPERMLFVVHREQILDRAIQEYARVLGVDPREFGKLTGGSKQADKRFVFATIQTLSQRSVLETFAPDEFDYILIDEVHRAGAASYERVIDHFDPQFLLGMTATPERSDGFNIFELFDFNVPYEIRLGRALENDMLSPFHYYGVADVSLDDGTSSTVESSLELLTSRIRVDHVLDALNLYAQAGVPPRGLIFCSRKDEARALSEMLNRSTFRGKGLRTVALTGEDSIEFRETCVVRLERGELDYILTVDVFNEGVDIPSINQVVMLRQTQSSIVFVQQLGRGLRKTHGKDYLVVIDFIGNYANNYLIPTALFGDDSLNKESLRKNLVSAEERGVLPGLSSVRFDRIAQERVLKAIASAKLDSLANLKGAVELMRNRLGRLPALHDFLRFESADPVLLATRSGNYPSLLKRLLKEDHGLAPEELDALTLLSAEALDTKRPHELLLVDSLVRRGPLTRGDFLEVLEDSGALASDLHVESAARSLTLDFHTQGERAKYKRPIVEARGNTLALTEEFAAAYRTRPAFSTAVDDLIVTGLEVVGQRYDAATTFTRGRQYSRKDACRLLGWPKNSSSTIYGYKVDKATASAPIFVTLHKGDHISASTAYEDELLDRSNMRWFTRSKRTLASGEVSAIVNGRAKTHVFSKKSDAEGSDFYYLGSGVPHEATQTTMPDDSGKPLDVVTMRLEFESPIEAAVFDYFHPVVTD